MFDIISKTGGKSTKVILVGSGFETEIAKKQVIFNGKATQILEVPETKMLVREVVQTLKLKTTLLKARYLPW